MIVDDNAYVRRALREFISSDGSFEVCGEADTPAGTLAAIGKTHPDLVLLDVFLRKGDGLQVLRTIKRRFSRLPVVILSMHSEETYGGVARRDGAAAYVTKSEATMRLLKTMRNVMSKPRRS